jgi:hypothetical protein
MEVCVEIPHCNLSSKSQVPENGTVRIILYCVVNGIVSVLTVSCGLYGQLY